MKSILITGCSTGIGYDAAHTLKQRGWDVYASCRKQEDCDRLISEGLKSPRLDYEDQSSIHTAIAEVLSQTNGKLDALFNNGAYAIPGLVEDLPTQALRQIFEANFFGWHELTRALLPAMRKAENARIVQCSSVLGFAALPFRAAYNSTKFALEGYTDTLRLEMHEQGIDVILIEPGPITTEIRRNSIAHFEHFIDWENSTRKEVYGKARKRLYAEKGEPDTFELPPSAVTAKLLHALESKHPKPRYYVTTPTYIMGILKRITHTRLLDWVARRG